MGSSYGGTANSCDAAVREPLLWISLAFVLLSLVIVVRVLQANRGQAHIGGQLGFLAGLWIKYLFAPLVYLIPGYCGIYPEWEVPGALVCLYGLAGFTAGTYLLPMFFRIRPLKGAGPAVAVPSSLRNGLLILGMLFFVAKRLGALAPGLQAIIAGGQQLMVVAVVLNIWEAARRKENKKVAFWVVFSFIFPVQTIVNDGFLSFGMLAMVPVLIFATTCIGKRNYFRVGVFSVIGLYLGLSLFVNYFRDRNQIRAAVWGGDSFTNRVERLAQTFENFELFSIHKPAHLDSLSGRLNQTWIVGAGVTYTKNTQGWAHGSTLVTAALGFVPRFIWKDKPVQGGSSVITQYTGIVFSEGSSFGIGQILELYVNFGSWMVFFGYMVIGGLLDYVDVAGRNALKAGNFQTFIYCFLICLPVQNVDQDWIMTIGNMAVGIVLVYGLQMFMRLKSRRRAASGHQPYHPVTHRSQSALGYVERYKPMNY
jgi:hypothetical protein